jgi:hypothetical protein
MLPPNLVNFIAALIQKTNAGQFTWSFDDINTSISLRTSGFSIDVFYSFNEIKEIGQYLIIYKVAGDDNEYRFVTDQYSEREYELIQGLFNSAQGSALSFPF